MEGLLRMRAKSIVVVNMMVMSLLVMASINLLAQEDTTQTTPEMKTVNPDGFIVDFEGKAPYPDFGWIGVSDTIMEGGKSTVAVTIDSVGAEGTSHSLKMTGSVVKGQNPYVMFAGAATRFHEKEKEMVLFDVSEFTGVTFWAKGDGNTYRIELPTADVKDHMYYAFAFTPPADEWQQYKIPFKGFKQMPYGAKVPWTATDLQGFHFMTVGGPIEEFTLHVDQIEFFKKESKEE